VLKLPKSAPRPWHAGLRATAQAHVRHKGLNWNENQHTQGTPAG